MYVPRAFRIDRDEAERFLAGVEFAQLVTVREGLPVATHLPVEFVRDPDEGSWIYGHVARGNPQWRDLATGATALLIAQGDHGYISPAWYEQMDVPTWNYRAVHVYGTPELLDDGAFRGMLERLVARHENRRRNPVRLRDYPPGMIETQMRAAVGFRLGITRLEGAFKLSQNKGEADRDGVVSGLRQAGNTGLADAMDAVVKHRDGGE
jgi:transcriptional regulator